MMTAIPDARQHMAARTRGHYIQSQASHLGKEDNRLRTICPRSGEDITGSSERSVGYDVGIALVDKRDVAEVDAKVRDHRSRACGTGGTVHAVALLVRQQLLELASVGVARRCRMSKTSFACINTCIYFSYILFKLLH